MEPGDRLWVKEACLSYNKRIYYKADEHYSCWGTHTSIPLSEHRGNCSYIMAQWPNPMFMPKKYSRLTLEIVSVRCERLQDISEDDLIKEHCVIDMDSPSRHFGLTWDRLNKKRGFPWESNPWVWVIDFRKVEK